MDKKDIFFISLTIILLITSLFLLYSYQDKKIRLEISQSNLAALQKTNDKLNNELDSFKQNKEPKNRVTCVDTENGINSTIYGYVDYKEYDEQGSVIATSDPGDVCVDAIIHSQFKENVLREYYCDSNNRVQYEHIVCPNYCKDGVCH